MSIKGNSDEEEELQNPPCHRSHRAQIPLSPPPPPIIEASNDLPQSPYSHWHGSQIQQSSQSSPTIEVDDDDLEQSSHPHSPPREVDDQIMHDPSRSPSPQTGSKRQHNLMLRLSGFQRKAKSVVRFVVFLTLNPVQVLVQNF